MNRWHGMLFYNGGMQFWDVVRNKIQDIKLSLKMLNCTMDGNRRPPKEPKTPTDDTKGRPKNPTQPKQPKTKPTHKPKVDHSQRPPLITNPKGTGGPSKKPQKKDVDLDYVPPMQESYNLRKQKPSAAAGSHQVRRMKSPGQKGVEHAHLNVPPGCHPPFKIRKTVKKVVKI